MKTKLLFMPLLAISLLAGCDRKPTNTGDSLTNYGEIQFDEADYICDSGSYGGFFLDVNVGRYLGNDTTYEFSYTSNYTADLSFSILISKPNLASYEMTGQKTFDLKIAHGVGDFLLELEDAQGILVYRNVIKVRKSYSIDEAPKKLFSVDKYQTPAGYGSYAGDWRLSFTSASPLVASFAGGDELEQNVSISFSAKFSKYESAIDCYRYNVTTISTNATQTTVAFIRVARCLDTIYVYESGNIITILTASI